MTSVMSSDTTLIMTLTEPSETSTQTLSQSPTPISRTPSPGRDLRGLRLFRAISKKLVRRSHEDLNLSRTSSSDSFNKKKDISPDSGFRSPSSDTGSDLLLKAKHQHSTSAECIRKVFQNLNVRSHSCHNTKEMKKGSKTATPKCILRSPVAYTYVRGLSGLPTQRIPKNRGSIPCGCGMQYMAGLNR